MDLEAMKAAFLAKGGKVTKVESGARAIESDRTIYRAMRNGTRAVADSIRIANDAERRHHVVQDAYRAARMQGWSREDSMDYAEASAD